MDPLELIFQQCTEIYGPLLKYLDPPSCGSIANLQFSPNTDLNLFADDMLLYKCIDSTEDVVYLQQDNDLLSHWSAQTISA